MAEVGATLDEVEKKDAFVWTLTNIKLPKEMSWDFKHRRWQIPILNDRSKSITVIKPAQVGMSTIFATKLLFYTYHIAMRAAYVLPRQKDFSDMVQTRVSPMINNSPVLEAALEKPDSVSIKKIGNSFIHFLEANTEPRMLDIDMLIIDETNLCNPENLDLYSARLYASKFKFHHNLSTPTVPNAGVDALIRNTDWQIWNVKCPYCGTWIEFDDNWLGLLKETKHRIYYGASCCDKCKDYGLSPDDIAKGQWQPRFPDRKLRGYQVVRTMDSTTSAAQLYQMWKTSRVERNFYTSALGLPYVADSSSLTRESILDKCVAPDIEKEEYRNANDKYYIGIDQGNLLHLVVLKERKETETLELVYANIFNSFKDVQAFISRFPKSWLLIDYAPNTHSARDLVSTYNGFGYMASFQQSAANNENYFIDSKSNEDLVLLHKHEGLDELFNSFVRTSKLKFYSNAGKIDNTVSTIADHLAALKRTYIAKKTFSKGEELLAVWEPTAPDHFAMALLYAVTIYKKRKFSRKAGFQWRII